MTIRRGNVKTLSRLLALAVGLACVAASGRTLAAVSLTSLFSDHMVVQRDMAVPVWGTATPNETINVTLGAQQASATAAADGKWMVRIPAQPAGGPFDMTVAGTSTVTVRDVYVGEVWLASGQSNMDYRVHCTFAGCMLNNELQEIAAANYPLIRSCNVPYAPSATPVSTVTTQWMVSSPTTVPNFSAAAYFFARELHNNLPNVAIGMIHASFGASTIQCWMPRATIAAIPSVAPLLAQFEANPNYTNQHNPYICYNGQINPLIPYAIRGVIWYQGESVTWGGNTYRDLQLGQIDGWRKAWGQDFTFLITQLANYNVSSSGWPILREAQLQASEIVPNTGLAVTIDIGEATNVHYGDKQDVGLRLGIAARGITYGQAIPYSGPIYDHMAIEGSSIRLFFKHTETGLTFKGNVATGFEIAGANNVYSPATARIDVNSTLVVSSPSVTAPTNVRYAWAGFPMASLYNGGAPPLPASPFRTDAPPLPARTGGPDGGFPDGSTGFATDGSTPDAATTDAMIDGAVPSADATADNAATPPMDAPSSTPSADGAPPDASLGIADAPLGREGSAFDAGTGSGAPPAMGTNSGGCSCRVGGRGNGTPGLTGLAIGWIALAGVRRRKRRGRAW
ncbi:MAG: sialate O-acetylesterase [Myxococcota bacterium]|nr:sialate O-acetylesterase [Myxococcota bacterium]